MKPYVWSNITGLWFMSRGKSATDAAHALIAHEPS